MEQHFKNIKRKHGNASVRLPNGIFRDLSETIKNKGGSTNVQQVAFAYVYLITIAFLYKYAHFVDTSNRTYIQNSDIKELLGYSRTTKSIDKIIKKNGVLDELGLTLSTKDYPVTFELLHSEKINNIPMREFTTIREIDVNTYNYNTFKEIVKNRNYEIKEPLFLTEEYYGSDYGTLYSIERTHQITIDEFLSMIFGNENCIDFLMYGYFKSKCKGYPNNMKQIALYKIISEVGMDKTTFYAHLNLLKEKGYIAVTHKDWSMTKRKKGEDGDANEYYFKGIG